MRQNSRTKRRFVQIELSSPPGMVAYQSGLLMILLLTAFGLGQN